DPIVGRDEYRRHAVAGVDLRQLDAGRTGAQDNEALGQLPRRCRLAIRPRADPIEPLDVVGDRGVRADRDEDRPGLEVPFAGFGPDTDLAGPVEPSLAADH